MIELHDLTRVFGQRAAVDGVSLTVPAGQLCALLGPNGAGKTTTIRMLMGMVAPTRGGATIAGVTIPGDEQQLAGLRARVGLLTETPGFYDRLTALENLTLFGRMYGLEPERLNARIEEPLATLGLWDRRHEMVATFSKGMKQKLALVRAIFHDPEVVFFDEPTAALDPESARVVRRMILSLKQAGRTIIVCTHNLAEAEMLADLVAIMRSRLVAFGPVGALGNAAGVGRCRITLAQDATAALTVVASLPGVRGATANGVQLELEVDDAARRNPAVVAALVRAGFDIVEVRVVKRTLEEFYLEAIAGAS